MLAVHCSCCASSCKGRGQRIGEGNADADIDVQELLLCIGNACVEGSCVASMGLAESVRDEDMSRYRRFDGFITADDVAEILQRPELKWQEDCHGLRAARRLLRNPEDRETRESFQRKLRKKLEAFMSAANPAFHGNDPPRGSFASPRAGTVPLCVLQSGDVYSIPAKALTQNLLIVGATGKGKSNLLRLIIMALIEGERCL